MTHISANIAQLAFGGFNDDGSLTGSTAIVATNTNWSQRRDVVFRVRFAVAETAGGDPKGPTHNIEYQINGGGWSLVGAGTPIQFGTSAHVADAAAVTTQRLGAAVGTFTNGEYDQDGTVASVTYGANGGTEMEFGLTIDSAQTSVNDLIELRLTSCNQYDQNLTVTAIDILPPDAPTLVSPADSADIDGSVNQTFDWTFSSPETGDAQTEYTFARRDPNAPVGVSVGPEVGSSINSFRFSPDGTLLAVAIGAGIKMYNTSDWSETTGPGFSGSANAVGFSPDGTRMAVGGSSGNTGITEYNTSDWSVTNTFSSTVEFSSLEYSPDGAWLATSGYNTASGDGLNGIIMLDTSNFSAVNSVWENEASNDNSVRDVAWKPDSSEIAIGYGTWNSGSGETDIYFGVFAMTDLTTPLYSLQRPSNGEGRSSYAVRYRPDGAEFVFMQSGSRALLRRHNADTHAYLGGVNVGNNIDDAAFSDDSATLYVGTYSSNDLIALYDVTGGYSFISSFALGSDPEEVQYNPSTQELGFMTNSSPHYFSLLTQGPWQFWNAGTGAWDDTPVSNVSAATEVTFPPLAWEPGT